MKPETLDALAASDGANTLMVLLLAKFLETRGVIGSTYELMMFLEKSAAEMNEVAPQARAIVEALRGQLAVLGKMGAGGQSH